MVCILRKVFPKEIKSENIFVQTEKELSAQNIRLVLSSLDKLLTCLSIFLVFFLASFKCYFTQTSNLNDEAFLFKQVKEVKSKLLDCVLRSGRELLGLVLFTDSHSCKP